MSSYKTTGIIIRRHNLNEADRIYSFLTSNNGIVDGLAKSIRKAKSKLSSHLEMFNQIELMFAPSRSLEIITSARVIKSFPNIHSDLELIKRGFLFCEMIYKLAKDTASASIYQLLSESLEALDGGYPAVTVELYFKLKLLEVLGYKPNLEHTLSARDPLVPDGQYFFHLPGGGLVDKAHAQVEDTAITGEQIKLWRLALTSPIDQVVKVGGIDGPARTSLPILNDFYDHLFSKKFKSAEI